MAAISIIGDRALTVRQVAEILSVSSKMLYEDPPKFGFFKVGSQWRMWPETLRSMTQAYNRPSTGAGGKEISRCQSESAKAQTSGTSISARQASAEFDKVLEQVTGRKRRNSTTS